MPAIELGQTRFSGGSAFAFEKAIETTERHRSKHRIAPLIAQWEVLLTVFKHGVEIPRLIGISGCPSEAQHRAALTSLMNVGEVIWERTNEGEDSSLTECGYDKKFISSNLNYLRSKYQEWYGVQDLEVIKQDHQKILDALASPVK